MDEYYQQEQDDRALMEREADEYMAKLLGQVPDPFATEAGK